MGVPIYSMPEEGQSTDPHALLFSAYLAGRENRLWTGETDDLARQLDLSINTVVADRCRETAKAQTVYPMDSAPRDGTPIDLWHLPYDLEYCREKGYSPSRIENATWSKNSSPPTWYAQHAYNLKDDESMVGWSPIPDVKLK